MKLIKATYRNFKGLKDFTFEPSGNNAYVYGDNGTGKTTLHDGILFLLFGKDSQNKKDFGIKTLTPDGHPVHRLEHDVEAVFDIGGRLLVLKKTYKEKWTRKRGVSAEEFTGHTTDHFIDGVPVCARAYADKIASICDEDTFCLLTNHTLFNTGLHWEKRRAILLEISGDILESDVIASSDTLSKLSEILGDRTAEDHKKVVKAQQVRINNELKKIPVRIDEVERGLPKWAGADCPTSIETASLFAKKAALEGRLENKQAEIAQVKTGGDLAEKIKQLRTLEARILEIKNNQTALMSEKLQKVIQETNAIKLEIGDAETQLKAAERSLESDKKSRDASVRDIDVLRDEWRKIDSQVFVFEQNDTCPTCKQPLPAESLAEAHEKALADFNAKKATELKEVRASGQCNKDGLLKLENEMEKTQETIGRLTVLIAERMDVLADKVAAVKLITHTPPATTEGLDVVEEMEALEAEIAIRNTERTEPLEKANREADALRNQLREVADSIKKIEDSAKGKARIDELLAEEKQLATEYEQLEKELFLLEQFTKAKVALLEDKISSKFKRARFKLFQKNINGGVEDCCETLYNGVPYSEGLNNGHRGLVGLDIIATLCEHYKTWPPVFYDNAESTTLLPEMKNQMICLYVSEQDKQLRIVVDGSKNEEVKR